MSPIWLYIVDTMCLEDELDDGRLCTASCDIVKVYKKH